MNVNFNTQNLQKIIKPEKINQFPMFFNDKKRF